jgi:hypothetical protein
MRVPARVTISPGFPLARGVGVRVGLRVGTGDWVGVDEGGGLDVGVTVSVADDVISGAAPAVGVITAVRTGVVVETVIPAASGG